MAAAVASGATLAHAYSCLGAAERRCVELRAREEELVVALEGERGKSPVRRARQEALERELEEEQRQARLDREAAQEQWEDERRALAAQIEDLTRATLRQREEHASAMAEQARDAHTLRALHDTSMSELRDEKLVLEKRLGDLERKSFQALDGLRQKLSEEQVTLEHMRQTLVQKEQDNMMATDAQQILSQSLAQARKEAEKLKGEVMRIDMERVHVAAELQREREARKDLEQKQTDAQSARQNLEKLLERAYDERQRLASTLSSLFSSLQDARLEVAASIIGAADSAQNAIRLEEQLDQERADSQELRVQVQDVSGELFICLIFFPNMETHCNACNERAARGNHKGAGRRAGASARGAGARPPGHSIAHG